MRISMSFVSPARPTHERFPPKWCDWIARFVQGRSVEIKSMMILVVEKTKKMRSFISFLKYCGRYASHP
jgi:hypothetical protein